MKEHDVELIHQAIDGVNTPEERNRLQDLLARDPEARKLYDDLTTVSEVLARVEAVEPPPGLKRAVMDALPAGRYARSGGLQAFWRTLRASLQANLQAGPRLAYAFCLGVVAGLAVYGLLTTLLQPPATVPSELYGALLPREAVEQTETAQAAIALDDVQGSAHVITTDDGRIALALDLHAQTPVEIRLSFDEAALSLQGFTRQNARPGAPFTAGAGQFQLAAAGEASFSFVFVSRGGPVPPLHLQLLRADQVVYEQALHAP